MPSGLSEMPTDYNEVLLRMKEQVRHAQIRAALSVNRELVLLYWRIGKDILEGQERRGWGSRVIENLAADLAREFPDMKGFSVRNLKYMRSFARAWPEIELVQQAAAQIPWFHNCVLLDKVHDRDARQFYIAETINQGWSRNVLVHQIESRLAERQGAAISNFSRALPSPQSDLACEILKDPYNFDFLTLGDSAREKELEAGLLEHIRQFLLELGTGFAFVGNQVHLEVGGEDFYIDLLFYHLKLRCFVVIDLKMGGFKPEYVGKMNFYLSAVDDLLRHEEDRLSIGLILCKAKNRLVVEYALRDMRKPMGIAEYQITASLPENLKSNLPSIEELEAELSG